MSDARSLNSDLLLPQSGNPELASLAQSLGAARKRLRLTAESREAERQAVTKDFWEQMSELLTAEARRIQNSLQEQLKTADPQFVYEYVQVPDFKSDGVMLMASDKTKLQDHFKTELIRMFGDIVDVDRVRAQNSTYYGRLKVTLKSEADTM